MNVLIIKFRNIGDVLLSTPLIANIKYYYPDSNIDFALNIGCEEMVYDNPSINNIIVYPVPAQNTITIKVNTKKPMNYVVDIIDYQGNLVKRTNKSLDYIQSIDIQNLSNGMYFINVWFEDGTLINNIIIK